MSAQKIMRLTIECGAICDIGDLHATIDAALKVNVEIEAKPLQIAHRAPRVVSEDRVIPPPSHRKGIAARWVKDQRVVFERVKNAQGAGFTRINVLATLNNLGMSLNELRQGKFPHGSLECALQSSARRQSRPAEPPEPATEAPVTQAA